MTEAKKRVPTSGEHPAVRLFRKKIESIQEGTFPALEELNARIDAANEKEKHKSDRPPDSRRDLDDDARKDDDTSIDVVRLPDATKE